MFTGYTALEPRVVPFTKARLHGPSVPWFSDDGSGLSLSLLQFHVEKVAGHIPVVSRDVCDFVPLSAFLISCHTSHPVIRCLAVLPSHRYFYCHAFHSPLSSPVLAHFPAVLSFHPPAVPFPPFHYPCPRMSPCAAVPRPAVSSLLPDTWPNLGWPAVTLCSGLVSALMRLKPTSSGRQKFFVTLTRLPREGVVFTCGGTVH